MKHFLRLGSNRKSRHELLSTSEASWAITKSEGIWENPPLARLTFPVFGDLRQSRFRARCQKEPSLPRKRIG